MRHKATHDVACPSDVLVRGFEVRHCRGRVDWVIKQNTHNWHKHTQQQLKPECNSSTTLGMFILPKIAQIVRFHELYRLVACTGMKYEKNKSNSLFFGEHIKLIS